MAAEERQFKVGYAATYRQLYGKSPTNDELQAAYNDYMQSKANGYNARRIADAENSSSNTPRQRTAESVQCKQCFDTHTCKFAMVQAGKMPDLATRIIMVEASENKMRKLQRNWCLPKLQVILFISQKLKLRSTRTKHFVYERILIILITHFFILR